MLDLLPAVGILAVAAITPGPNNVLVFNAGLRGGAAAVVATIAAIEVGSLLLFGLVKLGLLALLQHFPAAATLLALGGSAYLAWLGSSLMRSGWSGDLDNGGPLPSAFGVLMFQLINPKAWVLMGVFASATHHEERWLVLVLVMLVVFTVCLLLWASAGAALAKLADTPAAGRMANAIMGASLMVFAGLIGAGQLISL